MLKSVFLILGLLSSLNFHICKIFDSFELNSKELQSKEIQQSCDGGFIIGFFSQISPNGLNGLLFECDNSKVIGYKSRECALDCGSSKMTVYNAKECPKSVWGNTTSYCGTVNNPTFAIGYKIKKEKKYGGYTRINGIKLLCAGSHEHEIENMQGDEGYWSNDGNLKCPISYYLCQTQIKYDKIGINEVNMTCCYDDVLKSLSYSVMSKLIERKKFDTIDYIQGGQMVISTPEVTNWGEWYPWENCDRGFVYGFVTQVKLDGNSRGLTGVRLNCTNGRVIGFEPDHCDVIGEWDDTVRYCGTRENPKKN